MWSSAVEAAALCGFEAGTRGAGAPGIETRPAILAFKLSCGTATDQDVQEQVAFSAAATSLGDEIHVVASAK